MWTNMSLSETWTPVCRKTVPFFEITESTNTGAKHKKDEAEEIKKYICIQMALNKHHRKKVEPQL